MDPVTILPAVIAALGEAGPWLGLAGGTITLYIMERKRYDTKTTQLEKKLDEKETALRKLAFTLAGINAKTIETLKNMNSVLVKNQAALEKSETRLQQFGKGLDDIERLQSEMNTKLVEVCTHVQAGR